MPKIYIVTAKCGRESRPLAVQLSTNVHNGNNCEGCHFTRLTNEDEFKLISHNPNRSQKTSLACVIIPLYLF